MSLRAKILMILFLFFFIFAATDYGIHRLYILPQFLSIEKEEADKNMRRCVAALEREIKNLDLFANDWAAWDDTCRFMKKIRRDEYIETNLLEHTFSDNRINLIWFLGNDGSTQWGKFRDLNKGVDKAEFRIDDPEALLIKKNEGFMAGLMMTSVGPLIVSCRPIISSDRNGPVLGTLIMGRIVDDAFITQLCNQTSTDIEISFSPDSASQKSNLTEDPRYLYVSEPYSDILGKPLARIAIRHFRTMAIKGKSIIRESIVTTILAGSLLSLVLMQMLRLWITAPIEKLTLHVRNIRKSGRLIPISFRQGKGEISLLYGAFAGMIDDLSEIHQELETRVLKRTRSLAALNERLKAEVLRREETEEELKTAKKDLESKVLDRTKKLITTNQKLMEEIEERLRSEASLRVYHERLIHMTSELTFAEERERRKIATGLHDSIGQALTVAKMKTDLLSIKAESEALKNDISLISSLLEKAIGDTRALTFRLSPPVLHELGLVSALEWLSENAEKEYGLKVSFENRGGDLNLTESMRILAFQAARELVFNVFKHADATKVIISIGKSGKEAILVVEDNGCGFDYETATLQGYAKGFGLFSMAERLSHAGGRIRVDSTESHGTRVYVHIPADERI